MTAAPAHLGRYVLISEVARGAFGRLATACTRHDSGEAQSVLLRRIAKGAPFDPEAIEQIANAARRSLSACGDHVAKVIGVEDTSDELGIVFEYADGKDLRSFLSLATLKHQQIPPGVAIHIASSALEGLAELRAELPQELRTGTLWPDVVFIAADGEIKLLDPAVAASITRAPGPRRFRPLIVYSAPEELDDASEHAQSDVFRMGVLLWEMLSGKRLFSGGSADICVDQVRRAPIPALGELAPEHAPLAKIVARALERDPRSRYKSTDDLLSALADCKVARASKQVAAAYVTELLGSGIAIQRRAIEIALDRLTTTEQPALPSARPAGAKGRRASPAVLTPLVPPTTRPRLPLRPPPTRSAGSPIDPPESKLESSSGNDEGATPIGRLPPPPIPPPELSERDSSAPESGARTLPFERKHLAAAAAALAVLLVGWGVLALAGLGSDPPTEATTSASESVKPSAATLTPPAKSAAQSTPLPSAASSPEPSEETSTASTTEQAEPKTDESKPLAAPVRKRASTTTKLKKTTRAPAKQKPPEAKRSLGSIWVTR